MGVVMCELFECTYIGACCVCLSAGVFLVGASAYQCVSINGCLLVRVYLWVSISACLIVYVFLVGVKKGLSFLNQ